MSADLLAACKKDTNQDNGERSVGVYVTTVWRELEFAGGHVVDTGDITHRGRVARATLNLLAVRESLADAEIDEVISVVEVVMIIFFPRKAGIGLTS